MRNTKKRLVRRGVQALLWSIVALVIIAALVYVTQGRAMPVLNPQGLIAHQEYTLIMVTVVLGVFVIVPVFALLFGIAWKYRASNKEAKYDPDFVSHRGLEALWWGIPLVIIFILAIITWVSTHQLDPYKKIESYVTPVKVQVVSLEWKWLFIYPDYNVATLNYMNIPKNTPIELTLTSDAPMNSFWVPALAGQVYTMTGMSTKLHLVADGVGAYSGSSANISGEGYADMTFKVYSQQETDFETWARKAKTSPDILDTNRYKELTAQRSSDTEKTFALGTTSLYHDIIMKYMHSHTATPDKNTHSTETMDHSNMTGDHEGMDM